MSDQAPNGSQSGSGGSSPFGSGFPGGQVFRMMQSKPSGPSRIAMVVFLVILALPLLLLAFVAGLISLIVFLVLAGWSRLTGRSTPDWRDHDLEGRKGVRVKR
ncbi:MAG: hypothetical protein MK100_08185 [Phycisphaerales bacterium]|nr:hypothetical protein [Phycisphaerales bacterium]